MAIELIQVPGVTNQQQTRWLVRVLQIDGRDLVLGSLADWQRKSPGDHKKIMKVLSMIGLVDRICDQKKVKKSQSAVICTNTYWKSKSSRQEQNQAFETCHKLKQIYEQQS